jgi:hypothetical protein
MSVLNPPSGRQAIADAVRGLKGQSFTLAGAEITVQAPFAGTILGSLVGLVAGDVVTNVIVNVNTPGAGTPPANVVLGLFDKTGTLLAKSANVASNAQWAATGYAVIPLTAPFTVTATDGYYFAFLKTGNWVTTDLALVRGLSTSGGTAIGSSPVTSCIHSAGGQTDLVTQGFGSATDYIWFGWN